MAQYGSDAQRGCHVQQQLLEEVAAAVATERQGGQTSWVRGGPMAGDGSASFAIACVASEGALQGCLGVTSKFASPDWR
jgi:hypothetical protein